MIAKCTRGVLVAVFCVCCLSFLYGQTDQTGQIEVLPDQLGRVEVLRGYRCTLIPAGTEVDVNCDGISIVGVEVPAETALFNAPPASAIRECVAQPCFKGYYPNDMRVCQHTGNPEDTCRGQLVEVTIKATHVGTCSRECRCIRLKRLPREIPIKKWMWRCNI